MAWYNEQMNWRLTFQGITTICQPHIKKALHQHWKPYRPNGTLPLDLNLHDILKLSFFYVSWCSYQLWTSLIIQTQIRTVKISLSQQLHFCVNGYLRFWYCRQMKLHLNHDFCAMTVVQGYSLVELLQVYFFLCIKLLLQVTHAYCYSVVTVFFVVQLLYIILRWLNLL